MTPASPPSPPDGVEVRRAVDRAVTRTAGLDSRHSFSYGAHYDPDNLGFGALMADNEDRLAPGSGFADHRHRAVEIVTWVLAGALTHDDSLGHHDVIGPGTVQRLSAGTGVNHAEHAGPAGAHYVQMWVVPDRPNGAPEYQRADVAEALAAGDLVPVASGRPGRAPIPIAQAGAEFAVARLAAGQGIAVPAARRVHLHVGAGSLDLDGTAVIGAGDTVRITGGEAHRLTATDDAEILVWLLTAT